MTDEQIPRFACKIGDAPSIAGVTRTRIYDAIREKKLTARKAGRATVIEMDELRRWVRSLPAIGRDP